MNRRPYRFCAKCLRPKANDSTYVGPCCHGTPGLYSGCAVCARPWLEGPSRDYVCERDLVRFTPVNEVAR